MPRAKVVSDAANETGGAVEVKVAPSVIVEPLPFDEVMRLQRRLERDGLAVPPSEPPPRKKLRSF